MLLDTLLGFELEPYKATVKRKAIETSKFYFFDMGIVRSLRRLPVISPGSADYGEFFEHFIYLKIKGVNSCMHRTPPPADRWYRDPSLGIFPGSIMV